ADLSKEFSSEVVSSVKAVGPYLNFYLDKGEVSAEVLGEILSAKENYGASDIGNGKNIPLDMSSPNIAKPMSMGHLRSTVIGNALANIVDKLGDRKSIRLNSSHVSISYAVFCLKK